MDTDKRVLLDAPSMATVLLMYSDWAGRLPLWLVKRKWITKNLVAQVAFAAGYRLGAEDQRAITRVAARP